MTPPAWYQQADVSERATLGSLLRNPAAIDDVALFLRGDHFRTHAHQVLYKTVVGMWDARNPVDLANVHEELGRNGQSQEVAPAYLFELFDAEPTGANAATHAASVRDHAKRRALYAAGLDVARLAENPGGPVEAAVEEAERKVLAVAEDVVADTSCTGAQLVAGVYDRFEARGKGCGRAGISTGLSCLDVQVGGWRNGELIVVAGRPGDGKTALCLQLAGHAALAEGLPVRFVSLEQNKDEIGDRLLCSLAPIDGRRLRDGKLEPEEVERLYAAGARVRQCPLVVDDAPSQRVLRIAAAARRMKRRQGLALLVVDYLQFVEPDSRREPRHEQVSTISRRLKALARELEVPVIAAAQLNRSGEEKPRLSNLRESGGIEADADVVLLLHRAEDGGGVEVDVAKHRNGPTGKVVLRYVPAFTRFEDPASRTAFPIA